MGIRCLVLGVTLLLCVGAQDERPRSVSPPPREAAWSASAAATDALVRWVAGQLRSHRIARLEIVWVPGDIGTLIPLTPQALEEHPVYRIGMEPFSPNLCEEIAAALEGSAVALASQTEADFRWGCIFYDTHGNRALTIFFDASDWSGLLDGTPVVSNGEVVRLLERRCSCLREGDYRPQRTGKR